MENSTITLAPLSSGSKGNVTLIQTTDCNILIDAGLSAKKTEERLGEHALCLKDIDAIFITHEHSDHIGGSGVVARKANIPIYLRLATHAKANSKIYTGLEEIRILEKSVELGSTLIEAVSTSHDAADPVAFKVSSKNVSVGVVTDLGCSTTLIKQKFQACDALVLEMNHDEAMLKRNPKYAWPLKQRIMSNVGHLSNEDGAALFNDIVTENTKRIYLAHLSEENNDPTLAKDVLGRIAANNEFYSESKIEIAYQHYVSDPISI